MKINVSFAHLHSPLFFAGRNWGEKIDVKNTAKGKVTMSYDRDSKELQIQCEGKETFIPSSNVVSYEPMPEGLEAQAKHLNTPPVNPLVNPPKGKIKAQASSPMDHVHQGLGGGKTND